MAEEKKKKDFMEGKTLEDVTVNDLLTQMLNNTDELIDLEAVSAAKDAIDRVMILGSIDDVSTEAVCHLIRLWNIADRGVPPKERKPIKLLIDSPGGSLVGALSIADAIRMSQTPVYTINMGAAYSGGLLVFITGHRRFCYPSASFMFHEGATTTDGYVDAGKFRNYSQFYDQLILRMKKYILECTDMTEEMYKEKKNDDFWFFAEEAIELGFADEILEEFI